MTKLYSPHSFNQQLNSLSKLFPSGRDFESKIIDNSVFNKLLKSFIPEIERFESLYLQISEEHDINLSQDPILNRWESAVGIPDNCFPGTGTIDERRIHVIIKLACMNVSGVDDYVSIANKLGLTVEILPGNLDLGFPYTFPFVFLNLPSDSKFVLVVRIQNANPEEKFPYTFPISFEQTATQILKCVYNLIKPANVLIVYEEL